MRRGCLHIHRDADGRPYRWRATSLAFKGEHDPSGTPATWVNGYCTARGSVVASYSSGSQAISWSRTRRSPSSRSESIGMRP